MFDEQITSKRQQFRNSIRRRQIQQIFSKRRLKLQEQMIIQQKQEIMKQIQTNESKKQWIQKKAQQMGTKPKKEWFQIIRTLSISVFGFKDDFSGWIRTGIIKNLALTFKQQFKHLELADIAALTLNDVFYYMPYRSPQIKQILQEAYFIPDVIELCVPMETQATNYLELVNTVIYSDYGLRNQFIDQGLVQVLISKLKSYTSYDSDQLFTVIMTVYRLVYMYDHDGFKYIPKGNVVSLFMPILDAYLLLVKKQQILGRILKIFCCLGASQKQYILTDLYNCSNLVHLCFHLLTVQGNSEFRSTAANILGCIVTSNKEEHTEELVKRGLLDAVLTCSKMTNQHICIRNLLQVLCNVVLNSLDEARAVLNHDIFGYFILPCIQSNEAKQSEMALSIVSSLIYRNNLHINELLLKKFKILNIFMNQLTKTIPNLKGCIQILACLECLVKMYNQVYSGSENRVTQDLEKFYNISTVLAALQENLDNKKLHNRVNNLLNVLYGS